MNVVKIISTGNEEQGQAPTFMESSSSFLSQPTGDETGLKLLKLLITFYPETICMFLF